MKLYHIVFAFFVGCVALSALHVVLARDYSESSTEVVTPQDSVIAASASACAVPSLFHATKIGNGVVNVKLQWAKGPTGATPYYYNVYRGTATAPIAKVYHDPSVTTWQSCESIATVGQTTTFYVSAVDSRGIASDKVSTSIKL